MSRHFHSFPWQGQFNGPAAIPVAIIIQGSINVDGDLNVRKIPVEESPPHATWMFCVPHAIKFLIPDSRSLNVQLRQL